MSEKESGGNFIREIIAADNASGRYGGRVATRFPPEPNGYLHIGHAKAICIDFGLAREFGGTTNLRFDDTNPTTEDVEYVEAIQEDIRWLGFRWDGLYYASDYFEKLYETALALIEKGVAYVDSSTEDEIREARGDYYKKGVPTRYRDRPVAESRDLFQRMRAGEFPDGAHVLRAKIDLTSQNMNLRDPILYRIRHAHHHRTGDQWCIYPTYDYAHPLSDAMEKITHSICTLEFESHRPLYDWCIREAGAYPSEQIEFAKLNLTYTLMSKRRLIQLVQKGAVDGWDDPRMATLAGMRRRGYTPEAIRAFCERVGVAKADSVVDIGLLEHYVREDLNARCPRAMAVLKPIKLTITNMAEDEVQWIDAPLFPDAAAQGTRRLPFSRTVLVERDDVREEDPTPGARASFAFNRLAPGKKVRLRFACVVECESVDLAKGEVRARRIPDEKVPGTIHWVSAAQAVPAKVRLYDRLFSTENPGTTEGRSFFDELNPNSLEEVTAQLEPSLAGAKPGARYQFERLGYFVIDKGGAAWNRVVTLKDTWAKIEKKLPAKPAEKKAANVSASVNANEIGIEEFNKVDLRVGLIKEAGLVEGADKLIRALVDLGEAKPRQIFAGLRASYADPSVLVGKKVIVVANLKPRQMKFGLSEGMILAANHRVLAADESAKPGDKVS